MKKKKMKNLTIVCVLLITCTLQAFSSTAVKMSLKLSNVTLKEVFEVIENKSDYSVLVSSTEVNLREKVSVDIDNKSVEEILNEVLSDKNLTYEIKDAHIIIYKTEKKERIQQGRQISGTVIDENGEPIIGANVVEKGTTNGTVTDVNGQFSLNISDGATLQVSYIGYLPIDVVVGNRNSLNITIKEDAQALEEVIVVGYGVQKAATVTGSVAAVKGDDLMIAPTVNFSNAVVGKLPGLVAVQKSGEPGSDNSTFRIRGVSTLGDNSPLVVVDGIPGRSFERLTADDIESMSVLKDASAAIYGAQAANGVILITTKRGKTGKPEVTFTYNEGFSQPTIIPKMADAATYLSLLNEINIYAGGGVKYSDEEIQRYRKGGDPWLYPNTDWFDETFQNFASQRKVNASIRGGSEAFSYYVSVGGNYQDAVYKNSATNYSQANFRGNIDGKLNEYIRVSFDVAGRQENQNYPTRGASDIFSMIMRGKPNMHAYWPNGMNGPDIEYGNNPVVVTTNQTGYNKKKHYYLESKANIEIDIPWIQGLKLSANYAFDKYFLTQKRWRTPWYLYTWDGISYDNSGEPVLQEGKKGYSNPELWQKSEDKGRSTINAMLNYDKSFGDHTGKILVGFERITGDEMMFEAERKYYVSTALDELFAGGDLEKTNTGSSKKNKRMNFFGRINYDYQQKYLLEFLWRVDGSYIFPENKRYGFFPGVSVGWRVSEEKFWKDNITLIDYLKFRASWGQTGNDRIDPYQFQSSYGFYTAANEIYTFNVNTQNKILKELRIPNPNVTWEVDNTTNVGLDGQMLDGKLTFSAEYYYKKRTNILWNRNASVPTSTGLTLPKENIGEVENKGFEFQLGYGDQINDFSYAVSVNGGTNKNKIIYWDETPGIPDYQKTTGKSMPMTLDNKIEANDALYYKAIGVFKDQAHVESYPHWAGARPGDIIFEDVNGDNVIDGLDRVRIDKTVFPTFQGGLNINLGYKDFYTSINFQWATGAIRYRYFEFNGESGNFLKRDAEGRWTENNPNASKPRTWNRYNEYWRTNRNTYWLDDNDYLRLKNMEIGYNVPRSLLSAFKINSLRIYLSGQNLLTFTSVKDFDPETTDARDYPLSRVYNIGVSLKF